MTTGQKKLTVFIGQDVPTYSEIYDYLNSNPEWRVYLRKEYLRPAFVEAPTKEGVFRQEEEKQLLIDAQVTAALGACLGVAVSVDMYAPQSEIDHWHNVAIKNGALFEVFDPKTGKYSSPEFSSPFDGCEPAQHFPDLPKAIWLDVDGTAFTMFGPDGKPHRGPFEYHKVHLDTPLQHTINVVKSLRDSGYKVVVLSGREESCKEATLDAFAEVGIFPDDIFMRPNKSNIPDDLLKYKIYKEDIEGKYNIEFAFDDRDKVVAMLRNILKIPVYQVNYGAF